MGDLISRQAVIDLLKKNTTRDIDDIVITNNHIKLIANMPKAYDVSKVIEQLEEKIEITWEHDYRGGRKDAFNEAIDIVKKGGVE